MKSEKMVEAAKLLKMNLQLFSKDDGSNENDDSEEERDFEKDAAYASMRRELEENKKKLNDANSKQEEADNWYKDNYGDMGINNEKEYRSYIAKQKDVEKNKELATKMQESEDPEKDIEEIIKESPYVKSLNEKVSKYEKAQAVELIKAKLKDELNDLNTEYELELDSLEQIEDLPNGDKILKMSQMKIPGTDEYMSLSEAYFNVNRKDIMAGNKEKAKNEALKALSSKNHLKSAGKNDTGKSEKMPSETLKMYKKLVPGKTDAEYKEHWLKNK